MPVREVLVPPAWGAVAYFRAKGAGPRVSAEVGFGEEDKVDVLGGRSSNGGFKGREGCGERRESAGLGDSEGESLGHGGA